MDHETIIPRGIEQKNVGGKKRRMLRQRSHSSVSFQEDTKTATAATTIDTTPQRFLQMLDQDRGTDNQFVCQSLDVVDACRGTSESQRYRGNFEPYDGPCDGGGKILPEYPIYKSEATGGGTPKYMYAIGVYPDNWSVKELQGLIRWRIVDFEDFQDTDKCRTESANINQIDFAADGQPYNYWPTIYCFDEGGGELDGFKSSTINIRCNDRTGGSGDDDNNGGGGGMTENTTLVLGILFGLSAFVFVLFVAYKRCTTLDNEIKKKETLPTKEITIDRQSTGGGGGSKASSRSSRKGYNPLRENSTPDKWKSMPFGYSSVMPDVSVSGDSIEKAEEPQKPSSMKTVSKPYELFERRISIAPEPPKTPKPPSPLPAPENFLKGNSLIGESSAQDNNPLPKEQPPKSPLKEQSKVASMQQKILAAFNNDSLPKEQPPKSPLKMQPKEQMDSPKRPSTQDYQLQQQKVEKPKQEYQLQQQKMEKPKQEYQLQQQKLEKPKERGRDPTEHAYQLQEQKMEKTKERGREPSENDSSSADYFNDVNSQGTFNASFSDGSFMSKSLTDMFKNIDQSLDQAISPEEDNKDKRKSYQEPPDTKVPKQTSGRGKTDDMDLSQRSRFMTALGQWSLRGRQAFLDINNKPERSRSYDKSKASKYANRGGNENQDPQRGRSKSLDTSKARNFFANSRQKAHWAESIRNSITKSPTKSPSKPHRSVSKQQLGANAYIEPNNGRRSRSKERSGANNYANGGRSSSKERSGANNYANGGRSRSKERSGANGYVNDRRSRSKERSGANAYAASNNGGRSSSKERSGANNYANGGRSRSKERSGANAYAESNKDRRSRSKERSGANAYAQSSNDRRSRSKERSGANNYAESNKDRRSRSKERSGANAYAESNQDRRPRSKERSGANNYAESNKDRRSRSKERAGANNYFDQQRSSNRNVNTYQMARPKSLERLGADAYAKSNTNKRSKSQERSASNQYAAAQKNERRSRSKERSRANDYASGKGRSRSLEQSGANDYATKKKERPRSLERTPAGKYSSRQLSGGGQISKPRSERTPAGKYSSRQLSGQNSKPRSHSLDRSETNKYANKGGAPKSRSRSLDTSNANKHAAQRRTSNSNNKRTSTTKQPTTSSSKVPTTSITKNPDGSVVVLRRRKRDDGAWVTTKTKYANASLARKHRVKI